MTDNNRLESILLKTYVGAEGGGQYKVHAIFGFSEFDSNGRPIITEIMIKVRPEDSLISSMVKESIISFNKAVDGVGFETQCQNISKSGFVGVICNYFLNNKDAISDFREDFVISKTLMLDPQNRLSTNYKERDIY